MPDQPKQFSPLLLRLATLLFPPWGLLLLWRSPWKLWRKLLGTLGITLFCVLYAAGIVFLLIRLTHLQTEWRGGYLPRLTCHKTAPDFDALERDRAARTNAQSAAASPSALSKPYWTGFRGPHRDGHYDEQAILTQWPAAGPRLLWRQPVGGGYSSFAIAEGLAFTLEQRRNQETATAYDLAGGREVWAQGWPAAFSESMGGDGPRATPTYSDGKIYALGAEGELRCLEARTGARVWSCNILAQNGASAPTYGVSASPLVVDDKLIVLTGAGHGKSVVGYDKRDGHPLWTALDDNTGYASPMLVSLAGEAQLLICAETRTVGLRPDDGRLLWEFPWRVQHDQMPIAQPVLLSSNRFLLSAGYFTGCAAVEVLSGPAGLSARLLWQNKYLKNKFTSSVFFEGHIYGLDEDILTCLDATTGQRTWKGGHYGYGQLVLASGHLVILCGDGDLALVRANPEQHQEVARFPAIQGKTWNHPALAQGKLLIRNAAEMACFDLGPPASSSPANAQ